MIRLLKKIIAAIKDWLKERVKRKAKEKVEKKIKKTIRKIVLCCVVLACLCGCGWFIYVHRDVIKAYLKGEPLPEPPANHFCCHKAN